MKLRLTQSHNRPALAILSDVGVEEPVENVRDRMLEAYHAGKLHRVKFKATVWTDGKNKNHYRFPPEELAAFAESFAGMPYLRDHEPSMSAIGGTILDSRLIDLPEGGKGIRQTIEAVKPWAIEAALDGTARRFSVGWDAADYFCTICEKDITDCGHLRQIGRIDKESGKKVELLWKGLEGVESSAVTHPAAPGTTTEEVMSQLATMAEAKRAGSELVSVNTLEELRAWVLGTGKHASGNPAGAMESEEQMLEKILSALGLPAGTAEAQVLSAVEALKAIPKAASKAVLGALGLAENASENDVVTKVMTLSTNVPREEHEKVVAELAGIKIEGLIKTGLAATKITPATEAWARGWAKTDPRAFESWLTHAPAQAPVERSSTAPSFDTGTRPVSGLSPEEIEVGRRFGKTPEQVLADKKAVADFERTGQLPKAN